MWLSEISLSKFYLLVKLDWRPECPSFKIRKFDKLIDDLYQDVNPY